MTGSAPAPLAGEPAGRALEQLAAAMGAAGGALAELAERLDRSAPVPLEPGTAPARAEAFTCAWAGSQLHAGLQRPLPCPELELALLAGDWLYARALELLAHDGDLVAIDLLAQAIAACAGANFAPDSSRPGAAPNTWQNAARGLATAV